VSLLLAHGVRTLVDVRRFPRSKRHPQFADSRLAASLRAQGIAYRHAPALGGWREPRPDSPNTAWRAGTFRGYADHMESQEFRAAVVTLLQAASEAPTAVMCAEADPSRCHRQLLADALVVAGAEVLHLVGPETLERHVLHGAARVDGEGRIRYPARAPKQGRLFR
jgi:uncharacterized protein (DUF488 family)